MERDRERNREREREERERERIEREREREDECVWMAGRKVEVVREIFRLPELALKNC